MDYLRHLFDEYGLPLVFASVFTEQLGPPIPSGPLLIVAGALSVEGRFSGAAVALVAWLGCMLGKIVLFTLGARFGAKMMDPLCRVAMSPTTCVGKANRNFDRWGPALLLVAEFIPGVRTLAPALAGAEKIGTMRFLFFSAIGAALWTSLYIGLGLVFSKEVDRAIALLARSGKYALALVAIALATYLVVKWWRRRRSLKAPPAAAPGAASMKS
jgi:membrane protein DedA with SNARE-associated domain